MELPLELILEDVKNSMAAHANELCNKYNLPPAIILQLLQEIVYENKLNDISIAIRNNATKESKDSTEME